MSEFITARNEREFVMNHYSSAGGVRKVRENRLKHLSISANQPADHESEREMKGALIILAMAGSALAGYYGREWQDVIDRNVENPLGPYEITVHPGYMLKTHPRTGRMWVSTAENNLQWFEIVGPKHSLAVVAQPTPKVTRSSVFDLNDYAGSVRLLELNPTDASKEEFDRVFGKGQAAKALR